MRQLFTKVQLVVLWLSGIIISLVLIGYSQKQYLFLGQPTGKYYTDYFQALIVPILIITGLLLATVLPKKKE